MTHSSARLDSAPVPGTAPSLIRRDGSHSRASPHPIHLRFCHRIAPSLPPGALVLTPDASMMPFRAAHRLDARRRARDILARVRADGNPAEDIRRNPRNHVAHFQNRNERGRLGRALNARETDWPEVVAAIWLLALTGCRRSEALNRQRNIGDDAIRLTDSKTGRRGAYRRAPRRAKPGRLPVSEIRRRQASAQPRHLLAGGLRGCEDRKLRIHDLRRTTASHAVMSGENLPLVGRLLGHRRHRIAAGYAHLADGRLVEAAEKVSGIIAEAPAGTVPSSPG